MRSWDVSVPLPSPRHTIAWRNHTERIPPVFNVYQFAARSDFSSSGRQLFLCALAPPTCLRAR